MADALISPVVGGAMWVVTAGVAAYSIGKIKNDLDDKKIPLMGVMGAFVFTAQMINFAIPATGSSGHLGGAVAINYSRSLRRISHDGVHPGIQALFLPMVVLRPWDAIFSTSVLPVLSLTL